MPLPLPFVERIHQRLMIRYGSAWVSKWAGIDQAAVQADWAEQLDGMGPDAIKAALANLPADFPPTCAAFRQLGYANLRQVPDARDVLLLRDARGGAKPSPEVLAALKAIAGLGVLNAVGANWPDTATEK